jgi:predicted SAM-dependent methyltransferase
MKPSQLLQKAQRATASVENRYIGYAMRREAERRLGVYSEPYRLNLGCGTVKFEKPWINIDLERTADVRWDLTRPMPLKDSSCELIYSEHVLEHFPPDQGTALLSECHRLLTPDGVLRIAMPSLDYVTRKYLSEDWKDQDWLKWPEFQFIQTEAEMLNISFRWWGHQWIYDSKELSRRLHDAGFASIRAVALGESDVPQLRNRETRPDSNLIYEAVR